MPGRDPDHWLYRLSPDEWLRAAEHELRRAGEALVRKQTRPGVAGARRAAGMAWNGVLALAEQLDERYGRSYMDHLHALVSEPAVPVEVQRAADALVRAPLTSELVVLGPGDARLADAARLIVEHARLRIHPPEA
jgi:hypothetical protein